MKNLLFLAIFGYFSLANAGKCPDTLMLGEGPYMKHDFKMLEAARRHCWNHHPANPCLIKFYKIEEQTYHAICGRKR